MSFNVWATFVTSIFAQNFQISRNLVTLKGITTIFLVLLEHKIVDLSYIRTLVVGVEYKCLR